MSNPSDRIADLAEAKRHTISGKDIAAALQEAWDDWGADTSCFPECFSITRGPKLWANFAVSNFAQHVADALNSRLESQPQTTDLTASEARVRREALEMAARIIENGVETDSNSEGKHLGKRQDGNIAGLVYAKAIRALIDKPEGGVE